MNESDYRLERLSAALLLRRAELERKLAMKDETKPFDSIRGFVFLYRGAERIRMEEELAQVRELLRVAMP